MDTTPRDTMPGAGATDLPGVAGAAAPATPAPTRPPYTLVDGVKLLSGAITVARKIGPVVTLLRLAGLRNPLSWIGLGRRRGPLATLSLFGTGLAVGAGAGLLFAPRSGTELRRALVDGWVKGEMPSFAGPPAATAKAGDAAAPAGARIAPWVSEATVSIQDAPPHVVDGRAATTRGSSAARAQSAVAPPDHEHAVVDTEAARPARPGGASSYRIG